MRIATLIALLLAPSLYGNTTDISVDSPTNAPVIATDGRRTFVAWSDKVPGGNRLRAIIAGVTAPFDVGASGYAHWISVRYGGGQFLVAWSQATNLVVRRFAPDGRPIDPEPVVISIVDEFPYAVTVTDSGFAFAWDLPDEGLYMRTLPFKGVMAPAQHIRDTVGYLAVRVALSWNGSRFLFVGEYLEPTSFLDVDPPHYMFTALFDEAGNPVGTTPSIHAVDIGLPVEPQIATSCDDFLVVTYGPDLIYATTISSDGLASQPQIIFRWRLFSEQRDVVWNGRQYVVSLTYYVPTPSGRSASFLGAIHFDRDGRSQTTVLRIPPTEHVYGSSMAVHSARGELIATLASGADGRTSIRIREARDFHAAPTPPTAPQNVTISGPALASIMRWKDTSSNEEGFIASWFWQTMASAPPDATSATVHLQPLHPDMHFVSAWNAGGFSPPSFAAMKP